jgi:uncharacterized RDD family membrane protein YckC
MGWILLKQEYEFPSNNSRIAAWLIDGIVLEAISILVVWVVSTLTVLMYEPDLLQFMSSSNPCLACNGPFDYPSYLAIAFGLLQFVYFTILEGITGTTIGKVAVNIKVVREDGQPCGMRSSLVRNILRFVDGFPYVVPYYVGFRFVSNSPKKQRLGDRFAHTEVVRSTTTGELAPRILLPLIILLIVLQLLLLVFVVLSQ